LGNIPYSDLGPNTIFIDSEWEYGEGGEAIRATAFDVGPAGALDVIMESGIPIYNRGGWMDPFIRGTT
jgi:hypothetical protein